LDIRGFAGYAVNLVHQNGEGKINSARLFGNMFTDRLFTGQRQMRRPQSFEGAGLEIYQIGAKVLAT